MVLGEQPDQSRADTDESLNAERSGPTRLDLSQDRHRLDDLIERDRLAADRRLWKFRASADSLLAYERSFSAVGASLIERADADEHTRTERAEMDALLGRERDRADADMDAERRQQDADQAGRAARRRDTDAQLVVERRRGDNTLVQGELPIGSAFTVFDYDRIVQVLSNLLGNALKFTPEEGIVTLGVQRRGKGVEFVVRDNGPGIAATDLPHIFEKF